VFGGVFRKGGGNPGGKFPGMELNGIGALVVGGTAGSIPAARSRSSRELGSGTGVGAGVEARGC